MTASTNFFWNRCRILLAICLTAVVNCFQASGQADDYGKDTQKRKEGSDEAMHFFIVSKTHFDIGYSSLARDVVHEYRTTMIDRALNTVEENAKLAGPDEGYVWTIPGWPMRTILWDGQHPDRLKRVEKALTSGNLVMHALPFSLHTASADVESLARCFIDASSVARRYGLDFPTTGKMTDVPGHDWIIPTLLRHAGVKMFHLGSNPTNVQPELPPAFWWEGPDGSRLLTLYSNGYASGLLPPADWPHKTWLAMVMSGDNQGPHRAADVRKWIITIRSRFPGAKITVGSMDDFADAFLAEKPDLPVVRGTISDSWIHGPMSSPKAASALMNSRPKIRAFEALRTQNILWGTRFKHRPEAIADSYANSVRWSEHTWGLANQHYVPGQYGESFDRNYASGLTPNYDLMQESWFEHDQYALIPGRQMTPLLGSDLHTLAESVSVEGLRLVVYNPHPWPRRGVVDFALPFMAALQGNNAVKDVDTGTLFPLKTWGAQSHRVGRFVGPEIPSMGYKTFVFQRDPAPKPAAELAPDTIENAFFKVVFDPARGSIKSIIDKRSGKELVDQSSPHGFGQYLYQQFSKREGYDYARKYIFRRYHGSHSQITAKWKYLPDSSEHTDFSPDGMELEIEATGYGMVARLLPSAGSHGKHRAALTVSLYNELPYVDLQLNVVDHPATENPEAGWFCLPLKVDAPQFRIRGCGSIYDPSKDMIKGGNFAYLWTQGGLAVLDEKGAGVGIGLQDFPAVSLGKPGIYQFEPAWYQPGSSVYVNLFNNKWNTNFRSFWSGNLTARARLWSIEKYDNEPGLTTPVANTLSPLLSGLSNYVAGELPTTAGGIRLSRKGVELTAFGPNPDGGGTLLRVWENAGQDGELTVNLPEQMKSATAVPVDLRGRPTAAPLTVSDGAFTFTLGKFQPASFVLGK